MNGFGAILRKKVFRERTLFMTAAFLAVSLFLVSCQAVGEAVDEETDTEQTVIEQTVIEQTGSTEEWMELYFQAMVKRAAEATHITLIDVDFDEIPELFLSQLGASDSAIYHGYSFKEGALTDVEIPDEFMPTDLELYRHKGTGRTIWLANGMFRSGDTYEYIWNEVDFKEFSDVRQAMFWGWRETLEGEDSLGGATYQILENEKYGPAVTREQIDQAESEVFSDYERIDTLTLFSFTEAFRKNGGGDAAYDKELFYSFAGLYETTWKENEDAAEDDSLQLPIYAIVNFNLFHQYEQMPKYPISMVRKDYSRLDGEDETDIFVGCAQINLFPNPRLQMAMNRRIREDALGEWDVEREENIDLSILQAPAIYRDFLSIRTWRDVYLKESTHARYSLSAVTFNMETGEELELTDIITIDDALRERILDGAFENARFTHEQCLEYGIYDKLWDVLIEKEAYLKPNFYLNENGGLGVIMDFNHQMGDYLTFEASWKDYLLLN